MADEQLDLIFGALADATRRAILVQLACGEATVMELAEPFAISLPAVSKHLKVLERAGLISRTRNAQWLRCRLEPGPLEDAGIWIARLNPQTCAGSHCEDAEPGGTARMRGRQQVETHEMTGKGEENDEHTDDEIRS